MGGSGPAEEWTAEEWTGGSGPAEVDRLKWTGGRVDRRESGPAEEGTGGRYEG